MTNMTTIFVLAVLVAACSAYTARRSGQLPQIPCPYPKSEYPTEEDKEHCRRICSQPENLHNTWCLEFAQKIDVVVAARSRQIPCPPPAGEHPTEIELTHCRSICSQPDNLYNSWCLEFAKKTDVVVATRSRQIPCPSPAGEHPTEMELTHCRSICSQPENHDNLFCKELFSIQTGDATEKRSNEVPCQPPASTRPTELELAHCRTICAQPEYLSNNWCRDFANGKIVGVARRSEQVPCSPPKGSYPTEEEKEQCRRICAQPEYRSNNWCLDFANGKVVGVARRSEQVPCPPPKGSYPTEEEKEQCRRICAQPEYLSNNWCRDFANGKVVGVARRSEQVPCPQPMGSYPTEEEKEHCRRICAQPEYRSNNWCLDFANGKVVGVARRSEQVPCPQPTGSYPTEEEKEHCRRICAQPEYRSNNWCLDFANGKIFGVARRSEQFPCPPPAGVDPTESELKHCKRTCMRPEYAGNAFCQEMFSFQP